MVSKITPNLDQRPANEGERASSEGGRVIGCDERATMHEATNNPGASFETLLLLVATVAPPIRPLKGWTTGSAGRRCGIDLGGGRLTLLAEANGAREFPAEGVNETAQVFDLRAQGTR